MSTERGLRPAKAGRKASEVCGESRHDMSKGSESPTPPPCPPPLPAPCSPSTLSMPVPPGPANGIMNDSCMPAPQRNGNIAWQAVFRSGGKWGYNVRSCIPFWWNPKPSGSSIGQLGVPSSTGGSHWSSDADRARSSFGRTCATRSACGTMSTATCRPCASRPRNQNASPNSVTERRRYPQAAKRSTPSKAGRLRAT